MAIGCVVTLHYLTSPISTYKPTYLYIYLLMYVGMTKLKVVESNEGEFNR